MSSDWYLINSSNYFSGYSNDYFNENATDAFNELLNNSPEAYSVQINGIDKTVIIQKEDNKLFNTKRILANIGDFTIGDIVTFKNDKWLIITLPSDNKMYEYGIMQLCNSNFPIKGTPTKTQIGVDDYGFPVYEETYPNDTLIPCVVETIIYSPNDDTNQGINLPEGQIQVTIPYTIHDDIEVGKIFNMYDVDYEIIGIDKTKSINQVGLIIIKAKRVVN